MTSRVRRRVTAVLATLVGFVLGVSGAIGAQAAPPFATEATLTSISFVQSSVESGQLAELEGTWELPDNPATPAGFVVPLPEGLQGLSDAFPLLAPDGVTEMGQCTVTETEIVCDLDSAYLAEHPLNISGSFNFWAEVTTVVTEDQEVTYDFGDASTTVVVTPGACPDCVFDGTNNNKRGEYDPDTDTITWVVGVKAPATGMAGGETVTVVDLPGPGQEILPGTFVRHTDEIGVQPDGETGPIGWHPKPAGEYSVSADNSTVTFVSEPGYFYRVVYTTRITDGGAEQIYTNDAEITITGQGTVTVSDEVERFGGGGNGGGDRVGRFSITKDVLWPSDPIPSLVFEGTFTVTAPDGTVTNGQFTVQDGSTWTSEPYLGGSVIHLEEFAPTQPASFDWATPVFSMNDFLVPYGAVAAVTLTNEAALATGVFSAAKALTGNAVDLVPADATFTLTYTYPAGAGFPAGSGSLTLPADGTVVPSEPLPVGAVLTLAELTPDDVDGATWDTPQLSTRTVTIARDTLVEVIVTNTITAPPPVTPPTPPRVLATTGSAFPALPVTGMAVLAAIAGGILVQRSRVRRED
ncbi:DUF5979 domain-containing protein [Microbacterium sp. Root180]|uniref:DUF5979 domain-containing protein n=1 Tax=Microbacterium sp. Root180 TaxID=1736483 RepID=UPI000B142959|nr:DUF5979 domain-containing protein [Microbacterium sp. Root180]